MNTDDKETSFLTCLYNKFLIKQGLLKSKLISVAGMSSELRVIGNYAVSILTSDKNYKCGGYLVFTYSVSEGPNHIVKIIWMLHFSAIIN